MSLTQHVQDFGMFVAMLCICALLATALKAWFDGKA